MPRKRLDLPKWSGELAKPIDIPELWSFLLDQKQKEAFWAELLKARLQKVPLLAKELGIPVLEKTSDPMVFYVATLIELAARVCPGFQLKLPSGSIASRKTAPGWLALIDQWKRLGHVRSDHEACVQILKVFRPELAQPRNKALLNQQARTFGNLITEARTNQKRRPRLH